MFKIKQKSQLELKYDVDRDAPQPQFRHPVYDQLNTTESTTSQDPLIVKSKRHIIKRWWTSKSKKAHILMGVLLVLFIASSSVGAYYLTKKPAKLASNPITKEEPVVEEPPKPTTEKSTLTGVEVPIGTNISIPTTAVMIENSAEARPQSGLKDAGVVYEAITEGGITRFMAIYQEAKPASIGPVRSVRSQFLEFLAPFDAPIAHVGGSEEALQQVRTSEFKDLDQFSNPSAYQRITSRYAPHNVYTSRDSLLNSQTNKGWTTSKFEGFSRKDPSPASTPTASKIDINISSYLFDVHYDYDVVSNTYLRSEGGQPHIDQDTGKQLSPNVVVALVMPHSYSGIYSVYQSRGTGTAYVFQDGVATEVTWSKSERGKQLSFKDSLDKPFNLNPGQTWLTLVNSATDVAYGLN